VAAHQVHILKAGGSIPSCATKQPFPQAAPASVIAEIQSAVEQQKRAGAKIPFRQRKIFANKNNKIAYSTIF
jgi:uncharacterized lipoprotein YbaY